jgi:hypothetical protein
MVPDEPLPELPDVEIPDLVGPIIGWRAWSVERIGAIARLRSVVYDKTLWPPHRYLVATCDDEGPDHVVPEEHCSCGIYAALNRSMLVEMAYGAYSARDFKVIGEVALSGKVIIGEYGYRAAKARPVHLYVPRMLWRLQSALDDYDVLIERTNPFR